jgi:hypothetical protein
MSPTDRDGPSNPALPPAGVGSGGVGGSGVPLQASPAEGGRPPGVVGQILGRDQEDDDRPLPELPPLPADPKWRIEHLSMISAIGVALALCAGSIGFLIDGPDSGMGVAGGVFIVTVGFTISTLAIAWADVIQPALVLPVGLTAYVIKYALIAFVLVSAGASGWGGARPMAYGIAFGAVVLSAVQVWFVTRLANRRLSGAP